MEVEQTNRFKKIYKKLYPNQLPEVNEAIRTITNFRTSEHSYPLGYGCSRKLLPRFEKVSALITFLDYATAFLLPKITKVTISRTRDTGSVTATATPKPRGAIKPAMM